MYKDVEKSESGWWYCGRLYALGAVMPQFVRGKGAVLDVGAGFGAMRQFLLQFGEVVAYDTYPDCIEACKKRGYVKVYASLGELENSDQQFALIGAFDAIEHVEQDREILIALRSKLTPDGIFVATVPAHPFLFGAYDVAAHHFRRYNRRSLRALFEEAGYEIAYMSYWNASLFIPAGVLRLFGRGGTASLTLHPMLDTLFRIVVYLESLLLRVMRLPFGLSLIVVARKKR